MRALVEGAGAGVNSDADAEGNTPLVLALAEGHVMIAKYLMRMGADVEQASRDGMTPLLMACDRASKVLGEGRHGDDVVLALAERGADVNRPDPEGRSALMYIAAGGGHAELCQELVERYQADIYHTALDGSDVLSCVKKSKEMEELLRIYGVNNLDGIEQSPLIEEVLAAGGQNGGNAAVAGGPDGAGSGGAPSGTKESLALAAPGGAETGQLLVGAATEGNMVEARRLLETGVDVDGYHNGLTALYVSGSVAVCVCDSVSGPAACVWQCVSQCM